MEPSKIKQLIKAEPSLFPFISKFYDIEIEIPTNETEQINTSVFFGQNNTENNHSIPFYKPISTLIDFNEIYEK